MRKKECLYYRRDIESHLKNCSSLPAISISQKVSNKNCFTKSDLDKIQEQQAFLAGSTAATLDFWSSEELLPFYQAILSPFGGTEASAKALITPRRTIGRKLDSINDELEELFRKNGKLTHSI